MNKLLLANIDIIDLNQWGGVAKKHFTTIDELSVDGLHEINIEGKTIYFYAKNIDKINNKIIFSFNGAVSNREKKKGPFFTLLGVADRLNLPVISFSDDSTLNSGNLGLGWYAGNENFRDLPKKIATIINLICKRYNVSPFLVGGSGGGFASLNISNYLEKTADVFIWNPQTDITKYYKRHVQNYYNCAFKSVKSKIFNDQTKIIKNIIPNMNLCSKKIENCHNILYFQNKSDDHFRIHALPFIQINEFVQCEKNIFIDGNKQIITPIWGDGHIEPPIYVVEYVINEIMKNNGFDNIVYNIKKIFPSFDFDC